MYSRVTYTIVVAFCFVSVALGWKLIWEDDFKGASVDNSKWTIGNYLTHGPEGEIYMSDECYVENGNLVLRSSKRTMSGHDYTSCWLDTSNKFSTKFGRIEVHAKLPAGKGMWPAHWMMPNDNSCWPVEGEIDIMEYLGNDTGSALGPIYGTLHWSHGSTCGSNIGNGGVYPANGVDFTKDFHQYAIEWYPNGISWFVDNHIYKVVNSSDFTPSHPFFIILNSAVGGSWPGFPNAKTVFPQYHYIDYVRVYQ